MPLDNPPSLPTQESWSAPTLLNGWANYGAPLNPAGYWRDSFGVVHLRGVVANGAAGTNLFVLPTGYRPTNRELICTISGGSGNIATLARVDILSTGEIQHMSGGVQFLSLDGLTFRAV
ncbi:hypothetical protein [Pantanalinema sp. GBBB05]|uniref:hypothetical protein n=1 Tax=Pantanalinema sp. GBBB05 TaxID=2604139 RepID=UPI001D9FE93C|nr:hypothetical protein [Pantanalinema sp. GBBB05]